MAAARTPTPVTADRPVDPASFEVPTPELETETVADDRIDAHIPARILVDHLGFKANTVELLTDAEAAACEGWADTDEAAVEYCRSIAAE